MGDPSTPRWRQYVDPYLPGLWRTALLAVLCNLALELARVVGVDGYPWRFKTPGFPLLFLLGSLVVWMVVGLVHAVIGRLWVTSALTITATVAVAVADHEKVRLRREPLLPGDAEFAGNVGFVVDMVGPGRALAALATACVLFGAAHLLVRAPRRRSRGDSRPGPGPAARVAVRALTGAMCLLSLSYLAGFNAPGNVARGAYDALGATWRPWSQQRNYLGNGFVGGFLYNLDIPPVAPPAGYGLAEMNRIVQRYTEAADRINSTRDRPGLTDVNVVMVLGETFTDPTALRGVHVPQDPIPFTRRLMSSTMSGPMLAHGVGGGTANMEFEALTGMSMSQLPPQVTSPYQMLVPEYSTFPSAVRWLEQDGHRTLAMHPFTTEMYRRRDVYRAFGFDEFVHDETMHRRTRLGNDGYISDASAFDELHRRLVGERRPLFVNLVTMQNHMPYAGRYDDPVAVTGPDGQQLDEIGHYVRGLTHTDRALRDLIDWLTRLDEPTVVVFYGDHQPGTYPDSVFEANTPEDMHRTPYFVWANFPGPHGEQPLTSPIHFMDLLLARADARVPPYYALLHELRKEIPAMGTGRMFGPQGRPLRRDELSPRAARVLHDYALVQYDLSVGDRHAEAALFGAADVAVPTSISRE
jgi:phosphoglycerol transferase MdoB-like AlkP superfamily enzyme